MMCRGLECIFWANGIEVTERTTKRNFFVKGQGKLFIPLQLKLNGCLCLDDERWGKTDNILVEKGAVIPNLFEEITKCNPWTTIKQTHFKFYQLMVQRKLQI